MRARALSNIEMSVLGLAWLRGPRTTYAIMKELATSGSTYYKSRAGTAYSVVERLIRFNLIEYSSEPGHGGEKLIQVTEEGRSVLVNWLTPPIPIADIAHSADFVRLRFFFIGVLEPKQRLAFIDDSLASLRNHLARCEAQITVAESIGDHFGALATLSIVLETKARIQWLEIVRDKVE
jgi:DNA-binding PadR family transcriptional regulator